MMLRSTLHFTFNSLIYKVVPSPFSDFKHFYFNAHLHIYEHNSDFVTWATVVFPYILFGFSWFSWLHVCKNFNPIAAEVRGVFPFFLLKLKFVIQRCLFTCSFVHQLLESLCGVIHEKGCLYAYVCKKTDDYFYFNGRGNWHLSSIKTMYWES